MQNAGPTLAQLNSPPNNEDLTTLKNFGDLDSLNLDLEALTGDLLSGYPSEVKTEYVPVIQMGSYMSTPYSRGQSSLSTSVPTPVISHSDFHELSNLSNGGPPVSPNRLTLSPPSRGGLSPQYRPALSPTLSTHLIPATVPTSPPQPSSLHELLSRGQQQSQVKKKRYFFNGFYNTTHFPRFLTRSGRGVTRTSSSQQSVQLLLASETLSPSQTPSSPPSSPSRPR